MDGYMKYSDPNKILKVFIGERSWTKRLIEHWKLVSIGKGTEECKKSIEIIDFLEKEKDTIDVVSGFSSEAIHKNWWVYLYIGDSFKTPLPQEVKKFKLIWENEFASVWQIQDEKIKLMFIFMKPVPASWYNKVDVSL